MNDIINFLAEQTTTQFSEKREQLTALIEEAKRLNGEGNALKQSFENSKRFRKRFRKAFSTNANPYAIITENHLNNNNKELINKIHKWSLKSYKVIVQIRQLITGQELHYYIQDSSHHFMYSLNEEQYINFLSKGNSGTISLGRLRTMDTIKDLDTLFNKLKIQMNSTQKALSAITGDVGRIDLKKDALYNYLTIKKMTSTLDPSRLIELYTALLGQYEWRKEDNAVIFPKRGTGHYFTESRKRSVDNYISNYIKNRLHKDTDPFYQVGDAILKDEKGHHTLIENKSGDAVVSISTIFNVLKNISELEPVNDLELKEGLKQIFIKYPKSSGNLPLPLQVQKGAAEEAEKHLNEFFNNLTK